jgi:hypothetical protein
MRQGVPSETPATRLNSGESRCQPSGVPVRYSLISICFKSSASTPSQLAMRRASGRRKAGFASSGPQCTMRRRAVKSR